jgi:hypothetical protein
MTDAYGLSYFRFPALAAAESARKRKLYHQNDQSELSAGVRKILRYAAIVIPLIAAMTWGAMNTDVIREFNFEVSSLNPFSVVVDSAVTSKPANDRNTLHDSPVAETLSEMTTLKNALMYEEKSLTESMFLLKPQGLATFFSRCAHSKKKLPKNAAAYGKSLKINVFF